MLEKRKEDFVITVFGELNDHIRATDEKNVVIGGSFVALIAVALALLIDQVAEYSWSSFGLSLFILLIGTNAYLLQVWYRRWKKHYLEICASIVKEVSLEDKLLPFWLREYKSSRFSADELLLVLTLLINLSLIGYSLYQAFGLINFLAIGRISIAVVSIGGYLGSVLVVRRRLMGEQEDLIA